MRLRKVPELAPPDAIAQNPAWQAHAEATVDIPTATGEDLTWADGIVFGTPTRYGNVAAQLKQFLDTLGGLWAQGALANKVYSGLTSTSSRHGGQESTLLALYNTVHHFGGIIVTPGYTHPVQLITGNPYGTSHVSDQGRSPVSEDTREAARQQGRRVTEITAAFVAGWLKPARSA